MRICLLLGLVCISTFSIAQTSLYPELSFGQSKFNYSGQFSEGVDETDYIKLKPGSAFSIRLLLYQQPQASQLSFGAGIGLFITNGTTDVRTRRGNEIRNFNLNEGLNTLSIPLFVNYDFSANNANTFFAGAGLCYHIDLADQYDVYKNELATELQVGYKYKRLIAKLMYSTSLNDIQKADYKQLKITSLNIIIGFNLLKTKTEKK
jgi:hypothetical protein